MVADDSFVTHQQAESPSILSPGASLQECDVLWGVSSNGRAMFYGFLHWQSSVQMEFGRPRMLQGLTACQLDTPERKDRVGEARNAPVASTPRTEPDFGRVRRSTPLKRTNAR